MPQRRRAACYIRPSFGPALHPAQESQLAGGMAVLSLEPLRDITSGECVSSVEETQFINGDAKLSRQRAKRQLYDRYGVPISGLEAVPDWVTANLRSEGPPPDEATLDLDMLVLHLWSSCPSGEAIPPETVSAAVREPQCTRSAHEDGED
jgi:hypothetical protein